MCVCVRVKIVVYFVFESEYNKNTHNRLYNLETFTHTQSALDKVCILARIKHLFFYREREIVYIKSEKNKKHIT